MSNPKIKMKWNRVVDEVLGTDDDGVTGVRLKSTVDDAREELDVARHVPRHRPHAEHRRS